MTNKTTNPIDRLKTALLVILFFLGLWLVLSWKTEDNSTLDRAVKELNKTEQENQKLNDSVEDLDKRLKQEVKKNPALADEKTTRTIEQELLRSLAGLKITNVDIENDKYFRGLEKKKRIEKILIDAGLMKKFEKSYIPKSETPTQQTPPTGRLLDQIR